MPKPKVNYTWNYFDDIGNNRVKCRICSIEFTKKTTNQQNHLKRHHRIDRTTEEAASSSASSVCSSASTSRAINNNNNISPSNGDTSNQNNFNLVYNLLYSILQQNNNYTGLISSLASLNNSVHQSNFYNTNHEEQDDETYDLEENLNEEVESKSNESIKYFPHNDTHTSTENSESPYNEDVYAESNSQLGNEASNPLSCQKYANVESDGFASNEMEIDEFDGHLNKQVLYYWNYDPISEKVIDLSGRGIKSIDPDTFREFTCLEELNLSQNKIKRIESSLFDGLNSLKFLDLSSNQLAAFNNGTFKNLVSLDTLKLDNNHIIYILKDTFAGLQNLKRLNLSRNKVLFINVKAFKHMKLLELGETGEFQMEKNPIERIRLLDGMVYFY